LVAIAVISKIIGCGLPAVYFLKSGTKGKRVGYGMISRGEVGLIVAGVAISAGANSEIVDTLHRFLPNSKMLFLPDAHASHIVAQDQFIKELQQFIAQNS
jgi:Kef-type K+ transport system membrane component KefB